jgi:hypothetical protein
LKQFSATAPGKLSQRTVKKDVICIFEDVAEGAFAIRIAMAPFNLRIRGRSIPGQLPNEDTDF